MQVLLFYIECLVVNIEFPYYINLGMFTPIWIVVHTNFWENEGNETPICSGARWVSYQTIVGR